VKLNEKWELYAMLMFSKNLYKEKQTSNIEDIIIEKLDIDAENNITCSIEFSVFKKLFCDVLGKNDNAVVF